MKDCLEKQDGSLADKTSYCSVNVMYTQFCLLWGELLEQGSYLYYTRETIAWKWITYAVMQRAPAEKKFKDQVELEPMICEIVLHIALPS